MMIRKFFIITLVVFSSISCNLNDDDDTNFSIETLPIKEAIVPESFDLGSSYTLKVMYDLPSGCHSFYDLYYQYDGDARIVAVNSIVNTNSACTLALIEAEHTFVVKATQVEDYVFKFWNGEDDNGQDIFLEIVVPVNK